MSRRASAALPGSSWNPSNTAHTGPSSPRSSAADSRSDAYSGEASSAHNAAGRLSRLASDSVASGNRELLRTVRVSRMRWFGYPVPGQRLGQSVLEGRRLEAKLTACALDDIAGVPARIRAVRTCALGQVVKRHGMQPRRHTEGARDAFDEGAQADVLERHVVRLAHRVLPQVAGERAREPDDLDPGHVGTALVCLRRHEQRPPVGDALDV